MMTVKKTMTALLLVAASALCAPAQTSSGQWITHNRFNQTTLTNVVDAGQRVYYVSDNNLFCFDKTAKSQVSLSKGTGGLNGILVSNVYYNPTKGYVVITYDDSNIDIIAADGRVTNVPAIKDAVMYRDKTINDVTFGGGRIYIATAYGYLSLDDTSFQVKESRVYNYNLTSVAVMGQWLLMSGANGTLYHCKVTEPVDALGWARMSAMPSGKIIPVSDSTFLLQSAVITRYTATQGTRALTLKADTVLTDKPTNVQAIPNGFIANYSNSGYYYKLDASGLNPTKVNGGKELWSAAPGGDGTLWGAGASGLHSSTAPGTYYKPSAISLTGTPFYMAYSSTQGKLYLGNTPDNQLLASNKYSYALEMNTYDGKQWADARVPNTVTSGWYGPEFDPNDPSSYWISGRLGLIARVSTETNTTSASFNMSSVGGVGRRAAIGFDGEGNLVLAQASLGSTTANSLYILPKEKLHQSSYATSDFTIMAVPHMKDWNWFKGMQLQVMKKSDFKIFTNGYWHQDVIFIKNHGTSSDFESKNYGSFTDQDGKSVTWIYIYSMATNRDERVAIGTSDGMVILDPTQSLSDNFTVYAPSALTGKRTTSVTTDASNNWWVGTNNDGIYVLSADGSKVISHFTTSNSDLNSDYIYNLCADTVGNSVWVATSYGVQQYLTKASAAAADLSHVFAYPNPVRPDFTGMVTISGLTEDATVTIKDAKGQVVATLNSASGNALWDACDSKGERLPTGLYSIYATQSGAAQATVPCATVKVIK